MNFVQRARVSLFGIDDELKDDPTSVYSTQLNSTFYPIPDNSTFEYNNAGAVVNNSDLEFTIRNNTKRMKFSLNGYFKNLNLSNKAKLVIESVTIPNILNNRLRQSKSINNIFLRLHGLNNSNNYDSSSKGKNVTTIFTTPVYLNIQGSGNVTANSDNSYEGVTWASYGKINGDNGARLYINPNPEYLYNFKIGDTLMDTFEFELIYDMGFCRYVMKSQNTTDTEIPQQLILNDDKDDLEAFQITFLIMDEDTEFNVYNSKELLNKINRLIL